MPNVFLLREKPKYRRRYIIIIYVHTYIYVRTRGREKQVRCECSVYTYMFGLGEIVFPVRSWQFIIRVSLRVRGKISEQEKESAFIYR